MATKKSNKTLWGMLALIALIIAILLWMPSGTDAAAPTPKADTTTLIQVGQMAPDFTVELFDGSHVSLSSLRGKVVLLNFWATWCPPCREELTHVQTDLIERFAGREFVFLPISRGETRATVASFREKMGYTFPMGLDPDRAIYDLYATNSIPRNFLIDADGRVLLASIGYTPKEFQALLSTIEKTLEK